MNELYEKAYEYCKKHFLLKEGKYVLAISGGADSVFLFWFFKSLNIDFCAAHVNHNLRGKESDDDEEFVKALCDENNIPLEVLSADINKLALERKESIEECARNVRYEFFESVRKKHNADFIATAHNANDNAETIIFNLQRGSGLKGLIGILPLRDNIVRPILCISKESILDYLKQNNLQYRTDSTNACDKYTRNYIRNEIIPKLNKLNPNFLNTVLNQSEILNEYEEYFSNKTNEFIKKLEYSKKSGIDIKKFLSESEVIAKRGLKLILKGENINADYVMINGLYDFIKTKSSGQKYSLSQDKFMVINFDKAVIAENNEPEDILIDDFDKEYVFGKYKVRFSLNVNNFEKKYLIDYDKLFSNLTLRKRKEGDSFTFTNRNLTKSLKKLFIEDKIPLNERNYIPIISTEDKVVCVFAYGVDKAFLPDRDTKNILYVAFEEI